MPRNQIKEFIKWSVGYKGRDLWLGILVSPLAPFYEPAQRKMHRGVYRIVGKERAYRYFKDLDFLKD